ncbi:Ribonuclease H domain - like 10 [Theobroma cacao]|nr:Ribonuclease H domain - like 10 [Theobroma cacao]
MGGKPSGKINSGWGSHHVHPQESRRPRRGKESYAVTTATPSSFDTVSNASSMGRNSSFMSDTSYDKQSRSNASSMGNISRTGSCESLPSSRTNTFDSLTRTDASSSMTTADLLSRCAIPSYRTNATDFRSNASSSMKRAESLSRCAIQSVGSRSSSPASEDTFSRRAFLARDDVPANRHLYPPEWLRANASNTGASGSWDVQVNRQRRMVRTTYCSSESCSVWYYCHLYPCFVFLNFPWWMLMPYYPRSSLDHFNVTFEPQIQWPGYWSPPSAAILKINCAGAVSASSHQAGFGAVIRTQEGYFLAASSGKPAACEEAIVAEISAIKEGLRLADWMKLQEVEVRSDSLFVITELQKPGNSWLAFPYHQLLNEVKGIVATFRNCKFLHVGQEANSVAHWLAMYGFFVETIQSWFYTAPNFLLPALQQDVYSGYTY